MAQLAICRMHEMHQSPTAAGSYLTAYYQVGKLGGDVTSSRS
jgi:hypothetical protein